MMGTVEIKFPEWTKTHCLVEKEELQRLREETPTENQPAQRLRWQSHH